MPPSPRLIIVNGRPASGKTTLSRQLAEKMNLPLISRDQLKEDYINTGGTIDDDTDRLVYDSFFEAVLSTLRRGTSVIAEAAFQDKRWRPWLGALEELADLSVIICQVVPEIAIARFKDRLRHFPERKKYHGDDLAALMKNGSNLFNEEYESLRLAHSLEVDSSEGYRPGLTDIINFIEKNQKKGRQD